MVIDEERVFEAPKKLKKVQRYIKYYPKSWKKKEHHKTTLKDFIGFFKPTINIVLDEIFSIIFTPIFLIFG
jgi:hypothetical protein